MVEIRQFLQELPHSGRHLLGLLAEQGEQLTSIKVLKKETHSPDKGLLRGALLKELENFKDRSVVESQTVELSLKTITNLLALLRAHA